MCQSKLIRLVHSVATIQYTLNNDDNLTKRFFAEAILVNNTLFAGTVTENNAFFVGTV